MVSCMTYTHAYIHLECLFKAIKSFVLFVELCLLDTVEPLIMDLR